MRELEELKKDILAIKRTLYSHEKRLRMLEGRPATHVQKHVEKAEKPEHEAVEKEQPKSSIKSKVLKWSGISLLVSIVASVLLSWIDGVSVIAGIIALLSFIVLIVASIMSDSGSADESEDSKEQSTDDADEKTSVEPTEHKPVPKQRPKDIEALLGGSWLSKIGMFVLILGVGYFLKYSFDKGWIPPVLRVVMGLTGGIVLLILAELSERKEYHIYSRTLAGGGALLLYITVFAANVFYSLIDYYTSILASAVITIAVMILALRYMSGVICAFGLVGVYLMPYIVGISAASKVFLLIYFTIINAGLFVLMRKLPIAYIYAMYIIGAYLAPAVIGLKLELLTWLFIYYVLLNIMITYLAQRWKAGLWGVLIGGFIMPSIGLANMQVDYNIYLLYTFVTAMIFAYAYYRSDNLNSVIPYFLTIVAGPVVFYSKYHVGFTSVFVLLVLALTTLLAIIKNSKLMAYLIIGWAMIVPTVMIKIRDYKPEFLWYIVAVSIVYVILSHVKDWKYMDLVGAIPAYLFIFALLPKDNLLNTLAIAVIIYGTYLISNIERLHRPEHLDLAIISGACNTILFTILSYVILTEYNLADYRGLTVFLIAFMNAVLSIYLFKRLNIQVSELNSFVDHKRPVIVYGGITLALLAIAVPIQFAETVTTITWLTMSVLIIWLAGRFNLTKLLVAGIAFYIMSIYRFFAYDWARINPHEAFVTPVSFIFLYIIILTFFVASILLKIRRLFGGIAGGTGLVLIFGYITYETVQYFDDFLTRIMTITLLWAVYASILIFIGFKKNIKWLRLFALILFLITLLKLFLYDIWQLERIFKILAFVGLGVMLLAASFLYSKFKMMWTGD